jgi:hypothetical protein
MAERIVSPGVFTQERDLSFLPQGVAQIGAAFVGPTAKGPAFIPTTVQGIDGFVTTFGEPNNTSYTGYAARNYLQEAGSAVVVRVLGLTGYTASVVNLYATGSGGKKIFATLHPTKDAQSISYVSASGTTASFALNMVSSTSPTSASGLSTVESSTSFISKYFGTDPQASSSYAGYVYSVFPNAISQAGPNSVTLVAETASLNLNTVNGATSGAYSNASTPWIRSQAIGGVKHDLFKVHTLSDGTNTNRLVKVSITGVSPSTDPDSDFGSFSLLVRDFNDTDASTNVLESFDNLTLDPDSANYVARRIGDSAPNYNEETGETLYEGDYPNLSKYIRIEMNADAIIPDNAVPYGFAALNSTVSGSQAQLTSGSYVNSRWLSGSVAGYTTSSVDKRYYYGYNFTDTTSLSYLGPVANANISVGSEFNIGDLTPEVPLATAPFSRSIDLTGSNSRVDVGYRKFTVPMQGGFDGLNPARNIAMGGDIVPSNTLGFNLATSTSDGSKAFKRALDSISNADSVDLNLLVIPGVIYSQHSYIAQSAIDLCEQRGDCFYIVDLDTLNAGIGSVTAEAEELDTNYAAAYYPWVRILDSYTNRQMWAPPSVVLPEVYAYNDAVGAEWFAPAGLNRGGIPGAIGVKTRLSQGNRDELYESKVNPIAQFPGQGITVWGQKTLQRRASALDRVNVRRLLITVKKFIASSARYLVFEQNTEATRNRFLNIVNPYLAGIQQRSGLTAFRVVMDETNNTPDVIDRNILQGAIYLQPTRTAEFIKLDFNILPTGATFDTI